MPRKAKPKLESESKSDDVRATVPVEYRTFDVDEFAALRRVSRSHVYDLIADGRLKTVKDGRRRLIPGTEVIRTAKEQAEAAA